MRPGNIPPPTFPGQPPAFVPPQGAPQYAAPPFHPGMHPTQMPLPPGNPGMPFVPGMAPPPFISAPPRPIFRPPPGWTPALATIAPPNPALAASLTLYIGKIPEDLNDELLHALFAVFGKVLKWSRPFDALLKPKAFGFCTFEHGVSAWRCFQYLGTVDLYPSTSVLEEGTGESAEDANKNTLQIKAGTKEQYALETIGKTEEENTEVDLTVSGPALKSKLRSILYSFHADKLPPSAAPAVPVAPKLEPLTSAATTQAVNNLELVLGDPDDLKELTEEEQREKQIQSEIGKFRQRQTVRDKEVEELRKVRVQQRLLQIREHQEKLALATAHEQKQTELNAAKSTDGAGKKGRGDGLDQEDEAAKKKRRQQVLEMINSDSYVSIDNSSAPAAGGATEVITSAEVVEEEVHAAVAVAEPTDSAIKMNLNLSNTFGKSKSDPSAKSKSTGGFFEDTSKNQAPRELIRVDYTPEEVLSASTAASSGPTDSAAAKPASKQEKEDQRKAQLKAYADSLPVDKTALFAWKVDWEACDKWQVVGTKMRPWIEKKMVEYLGEEEKTLVDFIVAKLTNHCSPNDLLGNAAD